MFIFLHKELLCKCCCGDYILQDFLYEGFFYFKWCTSFDNTPNNKLYGNNLANLFHGGAMKKLLALLMTLLICFTAFARNEA